MPDGAPSLKLPGWPRVLSVPLAAAYMSLSVSTFRTTIAPQLRAIRPTKGRVLYLIDDLDRLIDRLANSGEGGRNGNSWD